MAGERTHKRTLRQYLMLMPLAALCQTQGHDAYEWRGTPAPLKTPRRRRVNTARREDLLAQVTDIFLAEGFTSVTVEDLTRRLRCSKSTLYGVGSTKEKLVVAATKHFFGSEAHRIEQAVAEQDDPQGKITTYLEGVAQAMRRNSPAFYTDMVTYAPTAEIYAHNTARAAERIREMIDDGVRRRRVPGDQRHRRSPGRRPRHRSRTVRHSARTHGALRRRILRGACRSVVQRTPARELTVFGC